MGKIPISKTIEFAYGFTFRNFLTLLGLSWLPLAIMAAGLYVALPSYFGSLQAVILTQDPGQMVSGTGTMFLMAAFSFACMTMIYVAVAREALGMRSGPAYFYFSLDAVFWRLLGAYFLALLIAMAAMIGAGIGVAILAAAAAFLGALGFLVAILIPVAVFVAFIYVFVRLFFFQAPVAVAEGAHIVSRSWSLSRGNVWRVFVIFVAIVIPLVIVQFAVQLSFFSSLAFVPASPDASPEETVAALAQLGAQITVLLPFLVPVMIVFYTAFISLIVSASAYAYRSLVPAAEGTAAEFA